MAVKTNGNDTSDDSMLHSSNTAFLCVRVLLRCACATANTGRTRLSMPSACITLPSTALHAQPMKAASRTTRRGPPAYFRINTSTGPRQPQTTRPRNAVPLTTPRPPLRGCQPAGAHTPAALQQTQYRAAQPHLGLWPLAAERRHPGVGGSGGSL